MFYGRRLATMFVALALILFGRQVATAGEHPEHPTSGKAENSEEAAEEMKIAEVTKEELAEAISKYVSKDADLKGGYFMVFDREAKQPLALTLEKVHKDRLSKVAADVYFACADFRAHDGKKVYDLDVFMRGPDMDHLNVTEISVHKQDGVARYGWTEKDGIWTKSFTKIKKESGGESPHPKSK